MKRRKVCATLAAARARATAPTAPFLRAGSASKIASQHTASSAHGKRAHCRCLGRTHACMSGCVTARLGRAAGKPGGRLMRRLVIRPSDRRAGVSNSDLRARPAFIDATRPPAQTEQHDTHSSQRRLCLSVAFTATGHAQTGCTRRAGPHWSRFTGRHSGTLARSSDTCCARLRAPHVATRVGSCKPASPAEQRGPLR